MRKILCFIAIFLMLCVYLAYANESLILSSQSGINQLNISQTDTVITETLLPDVNYNDSIGVYVSPNGDDATGNGTINVPYKTISYALTVVDSGDVIILRGGTYLEDIRIRNPCITIRSKSDEWAIIQSPVDDENIVACVYFDVEASHCKLQRVEVIGGYYYAIFMQTMWDWGGPSRDGASDVLIEDCKIHDSGRDCIKITPNCDNITIRRCEIYNSGVGPANLPENGGPNAEGIDNVNGDWMLVQDCYIHNTSTTGVYFKGGATNCVVERTFVSNCGAAGIFVGFDTSPEFFDLTVNPQYYESIHGIIRNCIVVNTEYAGIGMYASKNTKIYNNTIINTAKTAHSPIYFGISYQDWDPTALRPPNINPVIMNNIVVQDVNTTNNIVFIRYSDDLGGLSALDGMPIIDYNRYYKIGDTLTFQDRRPASPLDDGNLTQWKNHISGEIYTTEGDPMLDSQYHLLAGSQCINNGLNVPYISYDYDRQSRSGTYDIGADEWNGATGAPIVTAVLPEKHDDGVSFPLPSTYTLSPNHPNPFNPETTISYDLPEVADIHLIIYDLAGRKIRTLVHGYQQPGRYTVVWDGRDEAGQEVASGVYVYRFEAVDRGFVATRKMLLVR